MRNAVIGDQARFRPTWQQALGRGLHLGVLTAVALVFGALLVLLIQSWRADPVALATWVWPVLTFGPALVGMLGGVLVGRRLGTDIDAGGIRTVSAFTRGVEPWQHVVDVRAERRGARTVVSVYLDSGASVQLRAPYDGELFAADPRFELKVFALAQLWRSHRFGGVPG